MIVKEKDANFKICPTLSADSSRDKSVGCMGDMCMMWRWKKPGNTGYCGLAGRVEVDKEEPAHIE